MKDMLLHFLKGIGLIASCKYNYSRGKNGIHFEVFIIKGSTFWVTNIRQKIQVIIESVQDLQCNKYQKRVFHPYFLIALHTQLVFAVCIGNALCTN